MTTTVQSERARCIGFGICEQVADDYFSTSESGVEVLRVDVRPRDVDRVAEAIDQCPMGVLSLTEVLP